MAWYQPIPLFFGNIFSVDRAGKGLSNSTIYITYIISPFCLSCGIFGPFLTLLYTQTPFLALSGEFFFWIEFADSSLTFAKVFHLFEQSPQLDTPGSTT